jgi:hypothetical protein
MIILPTIGVVVSGIIWLACGRPTFAKVLTVRELSREENRSSKTIIAAVIRNSFGSKKCYKFFGKRYPCFGSSFSEYRCWTDLHTGRKVSGYINRNLDRVLEICKLQNEAFAEKSK